MLRLLQPKSTPLHRHPSCTLLAVRWRTLSISSSIHSPLLGRLLADDLLCFNNLACTCPVTIVSTHRPKQKANLIISGIRLHHQKPIALLGHTSPLVCKMTAHGRHHHGPRPIQEIQALQSARPDCLQLEVWQSALKDRLICLCFLHHQTTTAHPSHQTLTRQHHPQDLTQ